VTVDNSTPTGEKSHWLLPFRPGKRGEGDSRVPRATTVHGVVHYYGTGGGGS